MSRIYTFPPDHRMGVAAIVAAVQTVLNCPPDEEREAWTEHGYGMQWIWYSEDDSNQENHRIRVGELWGSGRVEVEITWGDLDEITPAVKAWLEEATI